MRLSKRKKNHLIFKCEASLMGISNCLLNKYCILSAEHDSFNYSCSIEMFEIIADCQMVQ